MSILDSIFSEALGTHFLESVCALKEMPVARLAINQPRSTTPPPQPVTGKKGKKGAAAELAVPASPAKGKPDPKPAATAAPKKGEKIETPAKKPPAKANGKTAKP